MTFGDPSCFAVEAYHEPLNGSFGGVWGRMCVHLAGSAFGDISEPCCQLNHAITAIHGIALSHDELWDASLDDLDDYGVYELLDTAYYRDDDRPMEQVRADSKRYHKFTFLTNWGEQFDGAPKCFITRSTIGYRILWRDELDTQHAADIPQEQFVNAAAATYEWFQEIVNARQVSSVSKAPAQ